MPRGRHGLLPSVRSNSIEKVKVALGAEETDVNEREGGKNNYTALILAAVNGHDKIVALLLADTRVDRNAVDAWGRSALICAVYWRHDEVVEALLSDDRVDSSIKDYRGRTAFDLSKKEKIKKLLQDHKAAKHAEQEGFVPAAKSGDDATVASALRNQLVDPNIRQNKELMDTVARLEARNTELEKALRMGIASLQSALPSSSSTSSLSSSSSSSLSTVASSSSSSEDR